jgi:hypothetical protein
MENFRLISLFQFAGNFFLILVYIAGLIVSGLLIRRGARQGGLLTLVGFALLLFNNLCNLFVHFFVFPQLGPAAIGAVPMLFFGLNSLISIVGMILIILGIWHLGTRSITRGGMPVAPAAPWASTGAPEHTRPDAVGSGAQVYPVPEPPEEPLPGDDKELR